MSHFTENLIYDEREDIVKLADFQKIWFNVVLGLIWFDKFEQHTVNKQVVNVVNI